MNNLVAQHENSPEDLKGSKFSGASGLSGSNLRGEIETMKNSLEYLFGMTQCFDVLCTIIIY